MNTHLMSSELAGCTEFHEAVAIKLALGSTTFAKIHFKPSGVVGLVQTDQNKPLKGISPADAKLLEKSQDIALYSISAVPGASLVISAEHCTGLIELLLCSSTIITIHRGIRLTYNYSLIKMQ